MSHAERDDHDLLASARAGDATSFAVLFHRHAAAIHAAALAVLGDDGRGPDPAATAGELPELDPMVVDTFITAMRRLDEVGDQDVLSWLLQLEVDPPRRRRRRAAEEAGPTAAERAAATAAPLPDRTIDAGWRELATYWPRGRQPRQVPRWVGQVALVASLLVLAVVVPYALLVTAGDGTAEPPPPLAEVVAEPIEDDEFDLTFEDGPSDPGEGAGDGTDLGADEGTGQDADDAGTDQ